MGKQWNAYETMHNKFNEALGKRIISHNHRGRRVEKLYHVAHHFSNGWVHFGELCLAMLFMAGSYMFGGGESLPNNTTLVYPLYQVSTLDCRTQTFSSLSADCKVKLPLIRGADYTTYQNEKVYTDIYTVLRGASYTYQWDQAVGAHYGTDIATAKGTPLYAIADGEVYAAEYNSAYGNVVKIKFKYKWEILYAIYGHMNSYSVKAGDLIKKWQLVWEVGNSGNTSGALWGYHVHFEIDKDAGGRPAYAFTNCAEVSKGHYEVIQQGLCRVQLFQYTKDPIALLEGAKATYPVGTTPSEPIPTPPVQEDPKSETPSHPSAPETPAVPNPSIPEETTPNKPDTPSKEENRADELPLDFSKVDLVGKEFLNKRDIIVEKNFGDSVSLSDDLKFTVKIKNKITGEFFHGTLNQPLLVIANNTNVSLNPVSTVLVSRGFAEITITPKKQWNTYLALNLGTAKIGSVIVSIK